MRILLPLIISALSLASCTTQAPNNPSDWTPVPSDYPTGEDDPRFEVCLSSSDSNQVTLTYRATRPTNVAVSFAVNWNAKHDFSGVGGSTFTDQWNNNVATATAITIPLSAEAAVSWQSNNAGYAYTIPNTPPTYVAHCPAAH